MLFERNYPHGEFLRLTAGFVALTSSPGKSLNKSPN